MNETILNLIKKAIEYNEVELLKDMKNRYKEYLLRGEPTKDNYEVVNLINIYFEAKKHFERKIEVDSYELDQGTYTKKYSYDYFDCEATIEINEIMSECNDRDLPNFMDRQIETFYIIKLEDYEI